MLKPVLIIPTSLNVADGSSSIDSFIMAITLSIHFFTFESESLKLNTRLFNLWDKLSCESSKSIIWAIFSRLNFNAIKSLGLAEAVPILPAILSISDILFSIESMSFTKIGFW